MKAKIEELLSKNAHLISKVSQLGEAAKCTAVRDSLKEEAKKSQECSNNLANEKNKVNECNKAHEGNSAKVSALIDQLDIVVQRAKEARTAYSGVKKTLKEELAACSKRAA